MSIRKKRSEYSDFKRLCDNYRYNHAWRNKDTGESVTGITLEEMAKELGFIGKNGKGQESKLSQYENGIPPLNIVQKYAEFFKLKKGEKMSFFYEALKTCKKFTVDMEKIKGIKREAFIKFILLALLFNRPEDNAYSMAEKWIFELEEFIDKNITFGS